MKLKLIRIYLLVVLLMIGGFTYALWNGITYYDDKVEKNTEYKGNRIHSGYTNRFYHK